MAVMRQGLLWLSERQGIFNFVRRNGLARKFASRFVAGETVDEGVAAALELSRRGVTASLDLLGESVTAESEAIAARDQYLRMLDRMAASGVEVNVSVKLTQMGLDIAEDLSNAAAILEKATRCGRPAGHGRLATPSARWTSSAAGCSTGSARTVASSSSRCSAAPSRTSRISSP
jgi:proline dehydrogenase